MDENNQNVDGLEKRMSIVEERLTNIEKILGGGDPQTQRRIIKKISLREFLLQKTLENDVETTLAISYYLEKYENIQSFNADNLKTAFLSAKEPIPGNINDKVNLNIKKGHMMDAREKKNGFKAWIITATGEKFVENNFDKK